MAGSAGEAGRKEFLLATSTYLRYNPRMNLTKFHTSTCQHCQGTGTVFDDKAAGQELRALRLQKRMTLRELSGLTGLSVSYLSDLEQGRKRWSIERIAIYEAAVSGESIKR